MIPPDAEEFLARHGDDESPYLRVAREAIASPRSHATVSHRAIPCAELLDIYRGRAIHLSKFGTPHAENLRAEVLDLCSHLERHSHETARLWSFDVGAGASIIFVELVAPPRLLGALRVISKLDVSEEVWNQLWGTAG
jgi:hypothetical protein